MKYAVFLSLALALFPAAAQSPVEQITSNVATQFRKDCLADTLTLDALSGLYCSARAGDAEAGAKEVARILSERDMPSDRVVDLLKTQFLAQYHRGCWAEMDKSICDVKAADARTGFEMALKVANGYR